MRSKCSNIVPNGNLRWFPTHSTSQVILSKLRAVSLTTQLYSLNKGDMRMTIPQKKYNIHFSRTPCEQEAKLILELLNSPQKPSILKNFIPPMALLSSKRDDVYAPFIRTYIISVNPKSHIPLSKTSLRKYRIKVIGKIISILASLHAAGILAGDTAIDNIVVKNNNQPIFRSAGQIRAMGSMGDGIMELLYFLCDLLSLGIISTAELIHLIRHYTSTNKSAYLHAKYFTHAQKSGHRKPDEFLHDYLLEFYSKYFC